MSETETSLERTAAVQALTDLVVATFALNGRFLEAGDALARPVGLTAAWWQVLGAVLREPRTVSEIARHMGSPDRACNGSQTC